MKREFIKELLPDITKEALDAIMTENGKDIETHKNTIAQLTTERDGLKTQLDTATDEIKSYKDMDIDGIKAKAGEWETKYNMKLSELMTGRTPSATYEGFVTNDDFVLAVDCSTDGTGTVADYAVVQLGVAGLDAQLNPVTKDKQYIRAGQSTTKTGNQRSFAVSGDHYVGDDFQDFALSHAVKYGTGNAVIRNYVYFCILNGKGEQGKVSIIVNSDGSGNAGESSEIDIELKKSGDAPTEYTYTASEA